MLSSFKLNQRKSFWNEKLIKVVKYPRVTWRCILIDYCGGFTIKEKNTKIKKTVHKNKF